MLLALAVSLGACASSPAQTPRSLSADPLEGYWSLGDREAIIQVKRCGEKAETLCGRLIQFEGNPKRRDYQTSDWSSWGGRLCGANVLVDMSRDPDTGVYNGHFYDHTSGGVYNLMLAGPDVQTVGAMIYHGTSADEFIDVAINSALGSAPDMFDGAYLALRTVAGQELLSETETWRRVAAPGERCDRPAAFNKRHSK